LAHKPNVPRLHCLLKHDPQNLKLCAFGYDFFQTTTHNPGLFVLIWS
jgi:hypothetical protein